MSRPLRTFAAAALILGLVALARPARAKPLCGSIGDGNQLFFYVIDKIKTKPGSRGAATGYFVYPNGDSGAFSGHYAVFGTSYATLSVSEGGGSTGFGFTTILHNFGAPFSADESGHDYRSQVDGEAGTVSDLSIVETHFADCKTVPPFFNPM